MFKDTKALFGGTDAFDFRNVFHHIIKRFLNRHSGLLNFGLACAFLFQGVKNHEHREQEGHHVR